MKYISEFRDGRIAANMANELARLIKPERKYRLMEFCGGHTHAIHRYGIPSLLPDNVEMIHGPGCPVCVLPISRIDHAIVLANQPNVILCTYADMMRVPGTQQNSLFKVKAQGADVRMVYSVDDALLIAENHPDKQVIFFAIGFETTTPPTAMALLKAQQLKSKNFTVFCNHVLTPPAMDALLSQGVALDGFIGPAHVSIVIGYQAYSEIARKYQKPIVISGFEPLDVMQSIIQLVALINDNQFTIQNQFSRAVTAKGNDNAQHAMEEVFQVREQFEWRGLGDIANSALSIQSKYADFDAEKRFPLTLPKGQEHKACACSAILRGVKKPVDCSLFAKVCTPENPLGSCMVSSEGACSAFYAYGRGVTHKT